MKEFMARAWLAFLMLILSPLVVIEPTLREIRRAWCNLCVIGQVRREVKRWLGYWSQVFPKR